MRRSGARTRSPRVAVLGAGIMGSATALRLARRGAAVTLFDAAVAPCLAASRWNEGKIHLGYLYAADPSLATVHRVLPGGLAFGALVAELIGESVAPATTADDDLYLCHRDSVVTPDRMADYFDRVSRLLREHPDAARYLVDVSDAQSRPLTRRELGALTDSPDIVAGFRVPERSVSTPWIADRLTAAVAAEPAIEAVMGTRIVGVRPAGATVDGPWHVETTAGREGPYDWVVNALWEGRLAVDLGAGLKAGSPWSHRFRLSLFVRTREPVALPSAVVATGPFGDIKNYNGRDLYLSWYPSGLLVDSPAVVPPSPPLRDAEADLATTAAILDRLGALLPGIDGLRNRIETTALRGGWVFAAGQGELSDPAATLHRRAGFGIARLGAYLSVDTGKYSTAPWLAERVADIIAPGRTG